MSMNTLILTVNLSEESLHKQGFAIIRKPEHLKGPKDHPKAFRSPVATFLSQFSDNLYKQITEKYDIELRLEVDVTKVASWNVQRNHYLKLVIDFPQEIEEALRKTTSQQDTRRFVS